MTHPSSLDLEAFACGESADTVSRHLGECAACSTFVERLRDALSAGRSRATDDVVARVLRAAPAPAATAPAPAGPTLVTANANADVASSIATAGSRARSAAQRRWWMMASSVAVPLAAAAALVLLLKSPSTKDALTPSTPSTFTEPAQVVAPAEAPNPETTFKGGIQIAVVRERGGLQKRFTGPIEVRPGDRLRVEVALDQEQAILAAVLGDDASWLELMPEGVRRPGTHFSERAARVDASPLRGTIVVGAPEVMARVKSTRRIDGMAVASVRVEWEGSL